MSQMRKSYLEDEWTIIVPKRGKRPNYFSQDNKKMSLCPFCPGNEHMTPPELLRYEENGEWIIRVVYNKYPLFEDSTSEVKEHENGLLNYSESSGQHEIIIESRDHSHFRYESRSIDEFRYVIKAYVDRYRELSRSEKTKYVFIFKNHKPESGASIQHPHSQVIAMPIIPPKQVRQLKTAYDYFHRHNTSIFDSIITHERRGPRYIHENNSFVLIAPFASQRPYQMMIIPKENIRSFLDLKENHITDLTSLLHKIIVFLSKQLNDPPFNYYFYTAPPDDRDYSYYRLNVDIFPKITTRGGLEKGTGIYANTLSPEDAASELKSFFTTFI